MDWEWNGRKWPAYLERGHCAENFDGHIAYTRMDGYGIRKDLILWTSDAMDDSACRLWRLLQCLDGDWALTCCSKLLQFRRCESRRVRECLCLCVMCRVRMCHLLNGNVYVMQLQSNWLSAYNTWYSSWTIVPRGPSLWHSVWRRLINIHVLFV